MNLAPEARMLKLFSARGAALIDQVVHSRVKGGIRAENCIVE